MWNLAFWLLNQKQTEKATLNKLQTNTYGLDLEQKPLFNGNSFWPWMIRTLQARTNNKTPLSKTLEHNAWSDENESGAQRNNQNQHSSEARE